MPFGFIANQDMVTKGQPNFFLNYLINKDHNQNGKQHWKWQPRNKVRLVGN